MQGQLVQDVLREVRWIGPEVTGSVPWVVLVIGQNRPRYGVERIHDWVARAYWKSRSSGAG